MAALQQLAEIFGTVSQQPPPTKESSPNALQTPRVTPILKNQSYPQRQLYHLQLHHALHQHMH
eukprot:7577938-Ditylum_brightwellii.AAC.1